MYDVIIIGAGTAGMTAGLYALRAGKKVLLLEGETFGGQITQAPLVENYPGLANISGTAFADGLLEQVLEQGAETEFTRVTALNRDENGWMVQTEDGTFSGKTVIAATGAKHRRLGISGEDELVGEGVSYCAVCDGAFYKGKTVAVVGGGNAALEEAQYLAACCEKVYVIHRRDSFRGESRLVERIRQLSNVECLMNTEVTALLGRPILEAVEIKATGTEMPKRLSVQGLFICVGQEPQNELFRNLVQLDESGYIVADEGCKTDVPGLFAAGDCRQKQIRQLTTAVSDGAIAGLAAAQI